MPELPEFLSMFQISTETLIQVYPGKHLTHEDCYRTPLVKWQESGAKMVKAHLHKNIC